MDALGAGPVLVGVDGSANARAAMEVAAQLAEALGAEVVAVHAVGLLTVIDGARVASHDHRDEIAAHLGGDWCAPLQARLGDRWRPVLRDGGPAEVLLGLAVELGAAMVVVGARGVGGHPDLMLGSTSHQVIHHARCPTVVVPPVRGGQRPIA